MTRIRLEMIIDAPIERVFDLARDIGFHERSMAATGEHAVGGRMSGLTEAGETVTWRARHFGMWWTLTSRVTVVERPVAFTDEQVSGPFRHLRHVHRFQTVPGSTFMVDEWEHTAPLRQLGRLADGLFLKRYMRSLLERRNAALKLEAESNASQF